MKKESIITVMDLLSEDPLIVPDIFEEFGDNLRQLNNRVENIVNGVQTSRVSRQVEQTKTVILSRSSETGTTIYGRLLILKENTIKRRVQTVDLWTREVSNDGEIHPVENTVSFYLRSNQIVLMEANEDNTELIPIVLTEDNLDSRILVADSIVEILESRFN